MEVRDGKMKDFFDAYQQKLGIEVTGNSIVFQVKGSNDGNIKAITEYVRVTINTEIGNEEDYGKIIENDITKAELNVINNDFKNNCNYQLNAIGIKILKWDGTSLVTINGQTALKVSYIRDAHPTTPENQKSPVIVNVYYFMNGDRKHSLTVSYRESEAGKWKSFLDKIVSSFTITEIN